jgi:archaeosine-15-forming tRNA-guanine transglycosylase
VRVLQRGDGVIVVQEPDELVVGRRVLQARAGRQAELPVPGLAVIVQTVS